MTLLREQIDVLLASMEANARQRYRLAPGDPALEHDLVAQTRALLRTVDLEHHLHICDYVQHLLLTMDLDEPAPQREQALAGVQHAASAGDGVPDLGLPLVTDPFDMDAYEFDDADGAAEAGDAIALDEGQAAIAREARAERRNGAAAEAELRAGLTRAQLATLDTMAVFGWKLEFVRRPMFLPPQPVAFDRNRQRFVVVDADGKAEEDPSVRIRA